MTEIYYVEDDRDIAMLVKAYLEQKHCAVTVFFTIEDAGKSLEHHLPDLALLDWNMPDGAGDALCRWIKGKWKALPIIFLTVRSDTRDIVSGFEQGADDYIAKPFELEVLYARMTALLRRTGHGSGPYLSCDGIAIDRDKMMVFYREEEITVSQAEYRLLLLLMENKGKTVTRKRLLEQIWDCNGNFVNDNTLTVTMKRLREKLDQPACLKTVRSFGYRMEDAV